MQLHLRRIRRARRLTLELTSRVLKRSVSTLSLLERGERDITLKTLIILARIYNVHPWDLVTFPEFPPPGCACKTARAKETA